MISVFNDNVVKMVAAEYEQALQKMETLVQNKLWP